MKKFLLISGIIATIITIVVGWVQLDLPRPAVFTEVQAVQEYTKNEILEVQQYAGRTRSIVLRQEWFWVKEQMRDVEAALAKNPNNTALRRHHAQLIHQLRDLEAELAELNGR